MLPYKSLIKINRKSDKAIYLQICQAFINEIVAGRIIPGTKLPGSRRLSDLLGVNRNTVISAFDELKMQGWLEIKDSSGTYIKSELPVDVQFSKVAARTTNFTKPALSERKPTYSYHFGDGEPDVRLAPLLSLTREMSALVKTDYFHRYLNYTEELKGDPKLRREVSRYLSETRGMSVSIEEILLTRGTVNSFHLFLNYFLKEKDCVIVSKPNYMTFNKIVNDVGVNLLKVPMDEFGMDVSQIENLCKTNSVKLIYVVPHHHHPTTVRMSSERRLKLLHLSEEHGFTILEDDYDYDFHYESHPILPLASYQRVSNIVYAGSFSKLLVPSIRLGFLVANEGLINELSQKRRYVDRCGDPLLERAMSNLMESGEIKRSLRKALRAYEKRRNLLVQLLTEQLSDYIFFTKPEGGMAIWCEFREDIDLLELRRKCSEKDLLISHPDAYNDDNQQKMRIGFANMNENEILSGFRILKEMIKEMVV